MNAMTAIKAERRASTAIQVFDALPDAALLSMWAEYVRVNNELDDLIETVGEAGGDPGKDPRYDPLDDRAIELHNLIVAMPATTPLGVAVKLRCAAEYGIESAVGKKAARAPVIPDLPYEAVWGDDEAVFALKAARDLEAALATDPDAEIVALFRQWQDAIRTAYRSTYADDTALDAACDVYRALEVQIMAIPAQGIRGLAIKAHLAASREWTTGKGDPAGIQFDANDLTYLAPQYAKGFSDDAARLLPDLFAEESAA